MSETKLNNPHDEFFKTIFSNKKIVIDYVSNFLPTAIVEKLKLEKLEREDTSYITPQLKSFFSDMVYTCPYGEKEVCLTLLFEHKAQVPKFPHLQLLRYMLEVYDCQVQDNKVLTPVIPIVIYHGKKAWHYRPFHHYFLGLDEHLQSFVPNFEYHLTNLHDFSDQEILALRAGLLINSFLLMKHYGEDAYIRREFKTIFEGVQSVWDENNRNLLVTLFVYLIRVTEIKGDEVAEMTAEIDNHLKKIAMTGYDMLMQKGIEKGIEKGIQKGIQKSIENMLLKGFEVDSIVEILEVQRELVLEVQKKLEK